MPTCVIIAKLIKLCHCFLSEKQPINGFTRSSHWDSSLVVLIMRSGEPQGSEKRSQGFTVLLSSYSPYSY